MCGIAAIFSRSPAAPKVDAAELRRIRDHMTARGPDAAGEWFSEDQRVGLGHRRLSIIDLSDNGAQPMLNPARNLAIVFNGEIYNYRELRSRLEKSGRQFRSQSDTEVLLHLYAEKGAAMLEDLRGMYAFAIWDANKRGLFLARDPFGIKPLYYADDGRTFRVASQVKALRAGGAIDNAPEPAGHVGFFLWGHVPEPYTLYRSIRALPAGHSLWVDETEAGRHRPFCNLTRILADAQNADVQESPAQAAAHLRAALEDSVRHHLIADVPVGIFLSAGLDSTTLTALAAREGGNLRTVTLGFDAYRGTPDDETPLAEEVARQYEATHQTIWVTRNDFHTHVDSLFAGMDQPSTDGVNTYFVSYAAAQTSLKVALSGLGGDELFGGYPSFREIPRLVGAVGWLRNAAPLGRGFRVVSAPFLKQMTSPKYAGLLEYGGTYAGAYLLRRGMFMPWELPHLLDADFVRQGWSELQSLVRLEETLEGLTDSRLKVSSLETAWYMRNQLLRDSDWAGMAHSLEIRVPLVDIELLRQVAPMLAGDAPPTKQNLAETPSQPLPREVLQRPKTGFQVPVREWLLADHERTADNGQGHGLGRGLRGWASVVYENFVSERSNVGSKSALGSQKRRRAIIESSESQMKDLKALVLLSDGFGGWGGIAKFNRDLLSALTKHERMEEVVALPRLVSHELGTIPTGLDYRTEAAGSKARFMLHVLQAARELKKNRESGPLLLICAHINLLPAACLAKRILGAQLVLIIHGVDAWQPTSSRLTNRLLKNVDRVISVSNLSLERFLSWAKVAPDKAIILPNSVDLSSFAVGPKDAALVLRYQLAGKKVIMTLGRLASVERYKGFDEVLEVLPTLLQSRPELVYVIAGDGPDRERLEEKARTLGVAGQVIFTGSVAEHEKADHFRLADAYVMPSSGEGFGIVYLEAMACGVPVVGSKIDGSREALRNGELGLLVDPRKPEQICAAVLSALDQPKGVPPGLDYFSIANFQKRVHNIVDALTGSPDKARPAKRTAVSVLAK